MYGGGGCIMPGVGGGDKKPGPGIIGLVGIGRGPGSPNLGPNGVFAKGLGNP